MKANAFRILWGVALIFGGALFLAMNLGMLPQALSTLWVIVFGVLSLAFFASFFLQGVQSWGFLFPAFIFAAIAAVIYLAEAGITGPFMGTLFLWGAGIPFLVPLALSPRKNWWALIPAWALGAIGLVVLMAERAPGELVGAFVMFAIALPFLVVYLFDRRQWWALIPAFVLGGIGAVVLLSTQASGEVVGAFVLFAIALPFFIIYFLSPANWWALMPAGIVSSVGMAVLLSGLVGDRVPGKVAWMNALIYLGIAVTFGVLWLRRRTQPTEWARYPAIGFGIAALIAFSIGTYAKVMLPVVLILLGLWMLTGFRPLRARQ